MNKIHPLYLLALSLFIAVAVAVADARQERKCLRLQAENQEIEATGKTLMRLKDAWKDPKRDRSDIDTILNLREVQSHVKSKVLERGVYRVEVTELGRKELDKMLGKLFNETVRIKKIELQRNSDTNVSAIMEFAL